MPFVERKDGPTLYYRVDDYTDGWRNAPYIVLYHGFGRNSLFWYRWIPYLSRYYRIVRTDMRGFGQSTEGFDRARPLALTDLADDVIAVMDALELKSAHFCGEHFGGTLGMLVAAEYPERIRTLSSIAGPVVLQQETRGEFTMGEASWEDALRKHGVKRWTEATSAMSRFPPEVGQEFLSWYAEEMGKADLETLIGLSTLCSSYDMTSYLPRISAPVLGMYARSRGRQLGMLRERVKRFTGIEVPTDYFMFYCVYPRLCAETVLHFAAAYDGITVSER